MNYVIHQFHQGDEAWHAHRATGNNAGDAAAMLGLDPKTSRNDLLRMRATGDTKQFSAWAQENLLARGHEIEAEARKISEGIIGEDLFPICVSRDFDGLVLSASLDGATMLADRTFECKTLNRDLREALAIGTIPDRYKPQLEQGLMILGAEQCLFVASDGTQDGTLTCWYASDPALRVRLLAGWLQFLEDLANYQHVEEKPAPVVVQTESLPAVSVRVDGSLAVVSNLDRFGERLKHFIATIPKAPASDEEFLAAKNAAKTLREAVKALDLAEAQALSQTESIESMRGLVSTLRETARQTALATEKIVEAREKAVRAEHIQRGKDGLAAHVEELNKLLGKAYVQTPAVDFALKIKGLRTVESLKNAIDTALANAKIEASESYKRIQANLMRFEKIASGERHQFPDLGQIVLKSADDFEAFVAKRISDNRAAEEKRLAAERERIRAEEAAKAEKAAREKLAAEEQQKRASAHTEQARQTAEPARAGGGERAPSQSSVVPPHTLTVADLPRYDQGAPHPAMSLYATQDDTRSDIRKRIDGRLDSMNVGDLRSVLHFIERNFDLPEAA